MKTEIEIRERLKDIEEQFKRRNACGRTELIILEMVCMELHWVLEPSAAPAKSCESCRYIEWFGTKDETCRNVNKFYCNDHSLWQPLPALVDEVCEYCGKLELQHYPTGACEMAGVWRSTKFTPRKQAKVEHKGYVVTDTFDEVDGVIADIHKRLLALEGKGK